MTNQHVVKPFTKICFLLKSISVLLACSQQCFSVHFCRKLHKLQILCKFANIAYICKWFATQIWHKWGQSFGNYMGRRKPMARYLRCGEFVFWNDCFSFFLLLCHSPQVHSLCGTCLKGFTMIISHGFNSKVPGILHMIIILFCSCWLNESRCLNESECSLSLLNTSSFPRIGSSSP